MLEPSARAFADPDDHVRNTEALKTRLCRRGELLHNLNAPHPSCKPRENGGLITKSGADLENRLPGLRRKEVDHKRTNEWLGDCLLEANRQRRIVICQTGELRRHKEMARHLRQSSGNPLVEGVFPSSSLIRSMCIPISSTMCRRRIAKCCSDIGFMDATLLNNLPPQFRLPERRGVTSPKIIAALSPT